MKGVPPGPPWLELNSSSEAHSYLCFYYSSLLSRLPVRDVNRVVGSSTHCIADCKSDPNWETQTFGLFSTCQDAARRGAVKNRSPYLFFFGNNAVESNKRGVTGYYRLKWYSHGGTYQDDYCLAADRVHFVEHPIRFDEVNRHLGTRLSSRSPRLTAKLAPSESEKLVQILHAQEDATTLYIEEIHRLEKVNARNANGLRYINFGKRDQFDWSVAEKMTSLGVHSSIRRVSNSAATDTWACVKCGWTCKSKARLKLCPECGAQGTLFTAN